jgi:hypothetical protein
LRIKYSPDARDRLKQLKEQAGVSVTSDKENYIDKNASTTDKKIRVEAFLTI